MCLAYMSKDQQLLSIIEKGEDIHTATARIAFHDPTIEKSDIRRKKAKAVGLGFRLRADLQRSDASP